MKVLGRIGGYEKILERTDGSSALHLTREIPDPAGDFKTIQLEVDVAPYRRGDILISDGLRWTKLLPPEETVGDVMKVICPRVGRDVQIRWIDPPDVNEFMWKHTLVLRKAGSYPVDIHDGVPVIDSYERDFYSKKPWHDTLPAGTEDLWFYKMFTFSEDEVWHSSANCEFRPIELTWSNLPAIVRQGLADKVFDIGDEVTVKGPADDPFYNELRFSVAGFDLAVPTDLTKTRSLTFAMSMTFGDYPSIWDKPWPEHQVTNDVRVTDRSKTYYIWDGTHYQAVTNLPIGKILEPGKYFEKVLNEERIANGGNRWANSKLREWLNSMDPTNRWRFTDYEFGIKPPLTVLPVDVVNAITFVRNKTALPKTDGRGTDITSDKIFLLSATEVFGKVIEEIEYVVTKDEHPQEIYVKTTDPSRVEGKSYFVYDSRLEVFRPAREDDFQPDGSFKPDIDYYEVQQKAYYIMEGGVPRQATDEDFTEDHEFKPDVVYYDQNINLIEENKPLPYFQDEELEPRVQRDSTGEPQTWWLRTPNTSTSSQAKYVTKDLIPTDADDKVMNSHHLVFGFVVS